METVAEGDWDDLASISCIFHDPYAQTKIKIKMKETIDPPARCLPTVSACQSLPVQDRITQKKGAISYSD